MRSEVEWNPGGPSVRRTVVMEPRLDGGRAVSSAMPGPDRDPADMPFRPVWRTYVKVPDLEASIAAVRAGGGTVLRGLHPAPGEELIAIAASGAALPGYRSMFSAIQTLLDRSARPRTSRSRESP